MIIVDVGPNHTGNTQLAIEHIYAAKESGADIVKFQLYDTDKICPAGSEFYSELKQGELTQEQWGDIVKECNKIGIEYLASVFDTERVDWCADMRRFKIASRSIYETDLINKVLSTGKDIIMSLGMTDKRGIPVFNATNKIDYLYCVSNYPTKLTDLKLSQVDFGFYSGFSDHSPGIEASITAIARGARIIEKHFILTKRDNDLCNSITPVELKNLVDFNRKVKSVL